MTLILSNPATDRTFAPVQEMIARIIGPRAAEFETQLFVSDDNCVLGCYCRLVVCLSWRRDWEEILVRGEMRADLPQFAPARFFPCNCDSKVACVLLQNRLLQS